MIDVKCNLDSKDSTGNALINGIVNKLSSSSLCVKRHYYWAFNLQNSRLFNELSINKQEQVLSLVSDSLLREAYFIEKAGMAFAAKMVLLSETTEERELYSHFGHQEANHLSMLRPFLKNTEYGPTPFLEMLTRFIETGDKQPLTYVIQVLLEGYGLNHYSQLSKSCLEPTLSETFNTILKDESKHYTTGVELFDPKTMTQNQRHWIDMAVYEFETHIKKGPTHAVNAMIEVANLDACEIIQLYIDIQADKQVEYAMNVFNRLKL